MKAILSIQKIVRRFKRGFKEVLPRHIGKVLEKVLD